MIGMRFLFSAGRYRVSPWSDGPAEWPPSPLRIAAALAQVWRRVRPQAPATQVGAALLALVGPPHFALPPASLGYVRLKHLDGSPGLPAVQGLVAISRGSPSKSHDAAAAGGAVEVLWPAATLGDGERRLLADLLDHLPFLGGADSWCRARLLDEPVARCNTFPAFVAGSRGEVTRVLCLAPGAALADLLAAGDPASSPPCPPGGRFVRYLRPPLVLPAARLATVGARAVCFRLQGSRLPPVSDAILVGDMARRAAMAHYGRRFQGALSPALSGRQEGQARADQHRHAHYLPTDEDGDGRLDHLAVWAPGGLTAQDVEALCDVRDLRAPGTWVWEIAPLRTVLVGHGDVAVLSARLRGPSSIWRSCSPFILTRHPKVRADGETKDSPSSQLRRELSFRGLEETLTTADIDGAGGAGAVPWSGFVVARPGQPAPHGSAQGFRLTFREPREGPIVAGCGAHFGLGLFVAEGDGFG